MTAPPSPAPVVITRATGMLGTHHPRLTGLVHAAASLFGIDVADTIGGAR